MHEDILKSYFEGDCSVEKLRSDLDGAINVDGQVQRHIIVDMNVDYVVRVKHLLMICDAVINGDLEPGHLEAIGFCLVASDHFDWDTDTLDGEKVSHIVHDWSVPSINYALNLKNTRMFRDRLLGEETSEPSHTPVSQVSRPLLSIRSFLRVATAVPPATGDGWRWPPK